MENDKIKIGGLKFSLNNGTLFSFSQSINPKHTSDINKNPEALIAAVINLFPISSFITIVNELVGIGPSGFGYNDAFFITDEKKTEMKFTFNWCTENDPVVTISFLEGLKIFHAYFNHYKEHVEQKNPKESIRVLNKETNQYETKLVEIKSADWYVHFLEKLKQLNQFHEGCQHQKLDSGIS